MEIGSDFRREKGQRDGDRDHSAGSNGSSNISVQVFGTWHFSLYNPSFWYLILALGARGLSDYVIDTQCQGTHPQGPESRLLWPEENTRLPRELARDVRWCQVPLAHWHITVLYGGTKVCMPKLRAMHVGTHGCVLGFRPFRLYILSTRAPIRTVWHFEPRRATPTLIMLTTCSDGSALQCQKK